MEQRNVSLYIMTDGNRTSAEATIVVGKLVHGNGSSGRDPGDKSDAGIGRNLAVARALRSLAANLERDAKGKVNHAESVKAHEAEIAEKKAAGAYRRSLAFTAFAASAKVTAGKPLHPPYESDEYDVSGQGGALKPGGEV